MPPGQHLFTGQRLMRLIGELRDLEGWLKRLKAGLQRLVDEES